MNKQLLLLISSASLISFSSANAMLVKRSNSLSDLTNTSTKPSDDASISTSLASEKVKVSEVVNIIPEFAGMRLQRELDKHLEWHNANYQPNSNLMPIETLEQALKNGNYQKTPRIKQTLFWFIEIWKYFAPYSGTNYDLKGQLVRVNKRDRIGTTLDTIINTGQQHEYLKTALNLHFDGHTPLSLAAAAKDFDLIPKLIKLGADPNLQLPNGDTVCHNLARVINSEKIIINAFLAHGARLDIPNKKGETAEKILEKQIIASEKYNQELALAIKKENNIQKDILKNIAEKDDWFSSQTKARTKTIIKGFTGLGFTAAACYFAYSWWTGR